MPCLLIALILLSIPQDKEADVNATNLVVFYQSSGKVYNPKVYLDGRVLAQSDNGRFFSIRLPAGTYWIAVESGLEQPPPLKVEVEADAVYVSIKPNSIWTEMPGFSIELPSKDEAAEKIKKLRALDKKWIRDQRVVLELPPELSAATPTKK